MFKLLNPCEWLRRACRWCFPEHTLEMELEEAILAQQRKVINHADTLVIAQADLRKEKARLAGFIRNRALAKRNLAA